MTDKLRMSEIYWSNPS